MTTDVRSMSWHTRPFLPSWQVVISVLLFIGLMVLLSFEAPNFFRYNNILNVLRQASFLGILALGMTVVMINGGIDLSLPANMALSAVTGALYMKATGDWMLAPLIMIGTGMAVGLTNGLAVSVLRMIPFVVTLAMMTMVSGATVWITDSVSVSGLPDAFLDIFGARPLARIPVAVFITVILGLVLSVVMRASPLGRWAYAVGINREAARVARVPIRRVELLSYLFAGAMAGVAAILLTARLGSASANMGNDGVVLDVVSACVVGGISIYGGSGRVAGALFGAVLIVVLSNSMNLLGLDYYLTLVVKGTVIVAYVALDASNRDSS